jgi:hypothetical protein
MRRMARAALVLIPFLWVSRGDLFAQEGSAPAEQGGDALSAAIAHEPGAESEVAFLEGVAGTLTVRDTERRLVVKLLKKEGRPMRVTLDPGPYVIELENETGDRYHTRITLDPGQRAVIGTNDFAPEKVTRPAKQISRPVLDLRRVRLTGDWGLWATGDGTTSIVVTDHSVRSENGGLVGGMSVGYRLTPEWMVTLGFSSRLIEAFDGDWYANQVDSASFMTTCTFGARYYVPSLAARSVVKPYVSAGIGPVFGMETESYDREWGSGRRHYSHDTVRSEAVLGGYVGGGLDVQPTSWLVIGTDVGYQFASKFSEPVGGRKDPSGFTFTMQMGVNLGRRLPAPDKP